MRVPMNKLISKIGLYGVKNARVYIKLDLRHVMCSCIRVYPCPRSRTRAVYPAWIERALNPRLFRITCIYGNCMLQKKCINGIIVIYLLYACVDKHIPTKKTRHFDQ